jgi:hypothetical protein
MSSDASAFPSSISVFASTFSDALPAVFLSVGFTASFSFAFPLAGADGFGASAGLGDGLDAFLVLLSVFLATDFEVSFVSAAAGDAATPERRDERRLLVGSELSSSVAGALLFRGGIFANREETLYGILMLA